LVNLYSKTEEQVKNMKPEERMINIVKNIPDDQLGEELKKLKAGVRG